MAITYLKSADFRPLVENTFAQEVLDRADTNHT